MAGVGALGVVLAEKVPEAAPSKVVESAVAGGAGAGSPVSVGIAKGAMAMGVWTKVAVVVIVLVAGVAVVPAIGGRGSDVARPQEVQNAAVSAPSPDLLPVSGSTVSLRGAVVDEQGKPVAGAVVRVVRQTGAGNNRARWLLQHSDPIANAKGCIRSGGIGGWRSPRNLPLLL